MDATLAAAALGLDATLATTSWAAVRRAYRVLALLHHPDRHPPEDRALHDETMKEINSAYDTLRRLLLNDGNDSDDDEVNVNVEEGSLWHQSSFPYAEELQWKTTTPSRSYNSHDDVNTEDDDLEDETTPDLESTTDLDDRYNFNAKERIDADVDEEDKVPSSNSTRKRRRKSRQSNGMWSRKRARPSSRKSTVDRSTTLKNPPASTYFEIDPPHDSSDDDESNDANTCNATRPKRARVAPVQYWLGQKVIYKSMITSEGREFVFCGVSTPKVQTPSQKRPTTSRRYKNPSSSTTSRNATPSARKRPNALTDQDATPTLNKTATPNASNSAKRKTPRSSRSVKKDGSSHSRSTLSSRGDENVLNQPQEVHTPRGPKGQGKPKPDLPSSVRRVVSENLV